MVSLTELSLAVTENPTPSAISCAPPAKETPAETPKNSPQSPIPIPLSSSL